MKFTDAAEMASVRMTRDGYLTASVRCARAGCQTYLGAEVGRSDLPTVTVYRPEESVFSRDSLKTFPGKPVTVGHPNEAVTAGNWRKYAVGSVGEDVVRDGEFVRVPIVMMDAAAIKSAQTDHRQISMGYEAEITFEDGVAPDGTPYQAVMRGLAINHLAAVPTARGGSELRIGDNATDGGTDRTTWGATPIITDAETKGQDMPEANLRTVMVDGLSVSVTDQGAQAIDKLTKERDAARTALTDAAAAHRTAVEAADKANTSAIAAKDEEIGKLKVELQQAKDAAPKPEQLDRLVADRAALVTIVKAIDERIAVDGKTDADLRKAAVVAKLGDEAVKDASEAEIKGMFRAIAKDVKPADPLARAIADAGRHPNDRGGDNVVRLGDSATEYTRMLARDAGAWKKEA